MTKDEALQLALDVLEKISMGGDPRWADQAIIAIKEALETKEEYHWSKLIAGLRVDDDFVVIKLKDGNDEARYLCNKLLHQMEMNK